MVRVASLFAFAAPCLGQDLFLASRNSDLTSCLSAHGFQGRLPDVEDVRRQNFVQEGFNQMSEAVDVERVAVEVAVREDVAVAVGCAAQAGFKICARSGGNSFTGASFACSTGKTMVLDLHPLNALEYDAAAGAVTVQAGSTLGQALYKLKQQSNDEATMVTGNCVGVGVGGFLLGGGMGALDSVDGLLCDRLRSAEFVLADGSQVVADETQNQELLWAACGAGGASLALMVSATVSTHPTEVVGKGVCTRAEFPQSVDAASALQQWLNFRQQSTHLRMQIRDGQLVAFGCFFGESMESYGSLEQRTGITGYESEEKWSYDSWVDVIKFLGPAGDFGMHRPEVEDSELMKTSWAHAGWFNNLRSRSLLLGNFGDNLEEPVVNTLQQCLSGLDREGQECIFIPVGERVRERSPSETAFAHRSAQVSFEVISQIRDELDAAWVDDIFHAMRSTSYAMGTYVNYPDHGLEDYQQMYWGSNFERLRQLKDQYDPEGLFAAPQPII